VTANVYRITCSALPTSLGELHRYRSQTFSKSAVIAMSPP